VTAASFLSCFWVRFCVLNPRDSAKHKAHVGSKSQPKKHPLTKMKHPQGLIETVMGSKPTTSVRDAAECSIVIGGFHYQSKLVC
jgi:hypothetical protein